MIFAMRMTFTRRPGIPCGCPPFRIAIMLIILATLVSCSPVGPDYIHPEPAVLTAYSVQTAPVQDILSATELVSWWQLCHDELLTSLIVQALENNSDLRIAELRIRQSRAEYRMATANQAPGIDTKGSYTSSRRSENILGSTRGTTQELFDLNLDVAWEPDLFGAIRRTAEQAEALLDAVRENRNAVQVALLADIALNYFELRGNQQLLQTSLANIRVQEETLALATGLLQSGLGNRLDVAQAQTQVDLSRSRLPALHNNIDQTTFRLALLVGIAPSQLPRNLQTLKDLPVLPTQLPQLLPTELVRRRPDIRQAEQQLIAANAAIGVAIADLYPRISLSAVLGLQSIHLTDLLQFGSRYWNAGPTINWSLFDGGRIRANIERQRAASASAEERYRQVVITALNEVERAATELHHEQNTYQALEKAKATAVNAVDLATGRYRSGLTDLSEVLGSERTLFQLQEQLITSHRKLAADTVLLYKAFGGGWSVPNVPNVPHVTPTEDHPK